jgi:hypothetical protein
MAKAGKGGGSGKGEQLSEEKIAEMSGLKEALADQEEHLRRMRMSHDEKVAEMKKIADMRTKALEDSGISMQELSDTFDIHISTPRLVNISSDPSLSGTLVYFLRKAVNKVGLAFADTPQDIVLDQGSEHAIRPEHAIMTVENEEIFLAPADPEDDTLSITVNGRRTQSKTRLWHGDSVVFGEHHIFQVVHPPSAREDSEFELRDFRAIEKERAAWKEEQEALTAQAAAAEALVDQLQKQSSEFKNELMDSMSEKKRLEAKLEYFQRKAKGATSEERKARKQIQTQLQQQQQMVMDLNKKLIQEAEQRRTEQNDELATLRRQLEEEKKRHAWEIQQLRSENKELSEESNFSQWAQQNLQQNQLEIKRQQEKLAALNSSNGLANLMVKNLESSTAHTKVKTAIKGDDGLSDFLQGLLDDANAELAATSPVAETTKLTKKELMKLQRKQQLKAKRKAELAARRAAANDASSTTVVNADGSVTTTTTTSSTTTTTETIQDGKTSTVTEVKYDSAIVMEKKSLLLNVLFARNLRDADALTPPDAYVRISIIDDEGDVVAKRRTNVVLADNCPVWNAIFDLSNYIRADRSIRTINFALWDKDLASQDDFLGQASIKFSGIPMNEKKKHNISLTPRIQKSRKADGPITGKLCVVTD